MKLKKQLFIFIILMVILSIKCVNAADYYVNKYGVTLTLEEYNFISYFYFDGYQDYMTLEDYNDFIDENIMGGEVKIETMSTEDTDDLVSIIKDTSYETTGKVLKLSLSCNDSYCNAVVTLTWKYIPEVTSYDLIGALTKGTTIKSFTNARMYCDGSSYKPTENIITSTGVASIFDIPTVTSSLVFSQKFKVYKGGTLNVSYQHAKKSISLSNSKKFTFNSSGAGGVFKFTGTASSTYDKMSGISVDI